MYKVLTQDFRSPIRPASPIWDGKTLPWHLDLVELDTSKETCAPGWHFCRNLSDVLIIGGLWPDGWPSTVFTVTPHGEIIEHNGKCRAASLTLDRQLSEDEIADGIREMSDPFRPFIDEMVCEQVAWRRALARPQNNKEAIIRGLQLAIETRSIDWKLKQFTSMPDLLLASQLLFNRRNAWDARIAWEAASGCIWDARDLWVGENQWDISEAWCANIMSTGRTWNPERDILGAQNALSVYFAARKEWIKKPADLLTAGMREAYAAGLIMAIPVRPDTLGWV